MGTGVLLRLRKHEDEPQDVFGRLSAKEGVLIYDEKDIKRAVVAAQAAIAEYLIVGVNDFLFEIEVADAAQAILRITPEQMYNLALTAAKEGK